MVLLGVLALEAKARRRHARDGLASCERPAVVGTVSPVFEQLDQAGMANVSRCSYDELIPAIRAPVISGESPAGDARDHLRSADDRPTERVPPEDGL